MNFTVYVAPFHPNGKPLHVKGFLKKFRNVAERNTKWLSHVGGTGIPIVGLDPSIVLTYRDEYLTILGEKELPFKVMLPQEFLIMNSEKCRTHAVSTGHKTIKYQLFGHCTEKTTALRSQELWQDVFREFGLSLQIIPAGCCGMAGTYGHETEHFEKSQGIYNLSWKEKIPEDPIDRQNILASGFSCRSQIKRIEGFRPLHPVQALLREINTAEVLDS
jgi:Fe-S oxidoreductase